MASRTTHSTSFSTDTTLVPNTPPPRSLASSSASTLTDDDYFLHQKKSNGGTKDSITINKQYHLSSSYSKADKSTNHNTTYPTSLAFSTTPTTDTSYPISKKADTYDPAEFNYSTPPGQRKSLYRRIKNLLKTFHIIRHWPKYEAKLERKLLYLQEDAAYWRGEVEERERLQEERLKKQREMMEEKWRRERDVWGRNAGVDLCAGCDDECEKTRHGHGTCNQMEGIC